MSLRVGIKDVFHDNDDVGQVGGGVIVVDVIVGGGGVWGRDKRAVVAGAPVVGHLVSNL